MTLETDAWFTPTETAAHIGLSAGRIYQLVQAGDLPASRYLGRLLINRTDLERFATRAGITDVVAPASRFHQGQMP